MMVLPTLLHSGCTTYGDGWQAALNGHRACIKALARLHAGVEDKNAEVSLEFNLN
jgi:hypothetical protein